MASERTAGLAAPQIRYALSQLRSRNGHHEFEHLCREVTRLRITQNVLPATGPVSAGGDQGRDFETFRSYIRDRVQGSFLAVESGRRIVFACTLQRQQLPAKIRKDLSAIMAGGPVDQVYFFCEADVPVARRHDLGSWAQENFGAAIEIIDGQALSELLASDDCLWIAERYLGIAMACGPEAGSAVHLEVTASGHSVVNQAGRDLHVHLSHGARRVASAESALDVGCPYPGLAAFTTAQAAWFFGRDRLTASLLSRLASSMAAGGPVIVVAASGAGKSSLLRAGLMHKVAEGGLPAPASSRWPQILFTPGAHPVAEAAAALTRALPGSPATDAGAQDLNADDLDDLLERVLAVAGPTARAVIVVDQFEELFALCDSEQERVAFITWLWRVASLSDARGPLAVVACGLRADFYGECTRYRQILRTLQDNQVLVGPMSADELRMAICCPAELVGMEIEPGLVEVLLTDLRAHLGSATGAECDDPAADYEVGRLPLLAHALQATWQMRHGSKLTVDGYRSTGGIEHAVAETAERVFASFDSSGQSQAKHIFVRLVKIGSSGSDDVRRPVSRNDLTGGRQTDSRVVDAFVAGRLLTAGRDAIQISHEELLRAWPRLRAWLDEDRVGNLIRQNVEDAAADWAGAGCDRSRLYRGGRLQDAAAWARSHEQALTDVAQRFLLASLQLARRTRALWQGAISGLAILALLSGIASAVAFQQRAAAIQQRDLAIYNEFIAKANQLGAANPSLAAQLLIAAYRMYPSRDLANRLIGTESEPFSTAFRTGKSVSSLTFEPGGHTLAVDDADGSASLWHLTDPLHPRRLGTLPRSGLTGCPDVLSPDSRTAAVANGGGTTQLWSIADLAHPRQIGRAMPASSCPQAFSANGRKLAVSNKKQIRIWDITNPDHPRQLGPPLRFGSQPTFFVTLSPDLRTAVVGNALGEIRLWSITNPAHPRKLGPPVFANFAFSSDVYSDLAEFSANGRILAVNNGQLILRLWDVANPSLHHPVGRKLNTVYRVADPLGTFMAISPDSRVLADGGSNGTVRLWNISDPGHPTSLSLRLKTGRLKTMRTMALSSDGIIAAAYSDGTVRLWSVPPPPLTTSRGCESALIAFSPRNHVLATVNPNGTVSLWNTSNVSRPHQLGTRITGRSAGVTCAAISPSGRTLALGNGNGNLALWDIADPGHPRLTGKLPSPEPRNAVASITFSPDGRVLAASVRSAIELWKITGISKTRALTRIVAPDAYGVATSIAFSRGNGILTAGYDGDIIQTWNIANPRHPQKLHHWIPSDDDFPPLAFRADGRILASVNDNGAIQLWNLTNPVRPVKLGPPITPGSGNAAVSVAFSPSGRYLASGNSDGSIQEWDTANPAAPQKFGSPLATGSRDSIVDLALSADDRIVAVHIGDTVSIVYKRVAYAIRHICGATEITLAQWRNLFPQLPFRPPCSRQ
jgi:WD40 repeat protein